MLDIQIRPISTVLAENVEWDGGAGEFLVLSSLLIKEILIYRCAWGQAQQQCGWLEEYESS